MFSRRSCARISSSPLICGAERASAASLFEGVRFLRGTLVMSVFSVDLLAMLFGMPRAFVPGARARVGRRAGTVRAAAVTGGRRGVRGLSHQRLDQPGGRQGVALLIAVAAWGTTIAGQPSKDVSSTPTSNQPSRVGRQFIRQP
jgi:hypothetical protein